MTQSAAMNQKNGTRKKWMVLLVVCLPVFVLAMDNSVLNLALPPISNDLGSSTSQLQWIIDAYILTFASFLLTLGAIGDRYGRKRLLQIGLVLFGAGSLGAALSNSSGTLIFFRGFSGVAGAMVMPSTLSIVADTFRDRKERAKAIGVWAGIFFLGNAIGPLVGGSILDYFYWGAVFLINLPVVAITLVLAYFFIGESKGEGAPKPDIPGVLLSIIGVFVLVYGIIEAGVKGWGDSAVLAYLGIGILILAIFALWEKKAAHPMLPLKFFKNMSFSVAGFAVALTAFALAGSLFFVSQYFQSVQGYSPVGSAIRTAPLAFIIFPMSIMSARIAGKIGTKMAVSTGIFLIGVGLFYLSQVVEVDTPYLPFFVGLAILGVGMGMTSAPATHSIIGSVPVNRAGVASAMNNTTRQLGQALGVAVLGSLMNSVYRDKIGEIQVLSSLTKDVADAVRSSIQTAHIAASNLPVDISGTIDDGANRAFVSGMSDAMFIAAFILWATALFTLAFLPTHVKSSATIKKVD
jgi:EmrB/QacA subfamily drug resistance transporter